MTIVGGIAGIVLALAGDWSIGPTMILVAGLGFWLGNVLFAPVEEEAPPAAFTGTAPTASLAARVRQLEDRVNMLSEEVERLRRESPHYLPQPEPPIAADLPEDVRPRRADSKPVALTASSVSESLAPAPDPAIVPSLAQPEHPPAVQASTTAQRKAEVPPAMPAAPDLLERAFHAARDWLLGGNTVVRVGIIVLFFGVAFLLKYAASNSLLPIELRLAGTALGAAVLLGLGWRLRERRTVYGLLLQGGGVGVLYLTVFAAVKLYALIAPGMALPLMVVICALSAFLAIRQDAAALAFMGSAGGFLAPVLVSSGGGSHVALFSYYALLNAGIFAIAWFKAWRALNLLGFSFTFVIGSIWGATAYAPEHFASTEAFLVLFLLMYVGISLLYALRRECVVQHYVDGTLVFGTPIAATALQAAMVKSMPFGLAWSAVALSAFYLLVAAGLMRWRQRLGLLFDAMLALGAIFATLALPFAFSGQTTGAAWAIEGAALVWMSVRQRRLLALLSGLLMQGAAAVAFLASWGEPVGISALPVANAGFLSMLMIALAGLFIGWWLQVRSDAGRWHVWLPEAGLAAALWGLCWWAAAGVREIQSHAAPLAYPEAVSFILPALVLWAILTAWLAHAARCLLAWPLARCVEQALAPLLALLTLGLFLTSAAPLTAWGWLAWPLAVVSTYAILWRLEKGQEREETSRWSPHALQHLLSFWMLCALLAFEGYWRLRQFVPEGAWSWSAWAYGLGLCLLAVATLGSRLRWPVAAHAWPYQVWGAAPLALLLWVWSIGSVASEGDAAPLFWLPLLNPLDVAQLLAFVAVAAWIGRLRQLKVSEPPVEMNYLAFATVFLWFNALLLRTLHHYFDVEYEVGAVLASFRWQQVFMLGWAAFACAALWFVRGERLHKLCVLACLPLMLVLWLWTINVNLTQAGGHWMRLPLFNPLDAILLAIYALIAFWFSRLGSLADLLAPYRTVLLAAMGATLFLWLNAMLLRTLHHWTGLPYTLADISHSTLAQAALTVFWALCALTMQVIATRGGMRMLWFAGGALLGGTVIKLFLFDLSRIQGLERIVAFIGVGVLLLLVGYFSPLPPRQATPEEVKP
ncbi:DUF2339 domain-containing protein [Herbaspirillum sp. C9C3]|nr:DUF2339 domain-containing protein [Herbaspirillum sp. C9C3]